MKTTFSVVLGALLVTSVVVTTVLARKIPAPEPVITTVPEWAGLPPDLARYASPPLSLAAVDTFLLASYSFDVSGACNRQGWTEHDLTAELDAFFHVASNAGELGGGDFGRLTPLEGTKSMWCGQAPSMADPYCGWLALPGYGNGWAQYLNFTGTDLSTAGTVAITYKVRWDSEPGYDFTRLQESIGGVWTDIAGNVYDGAGDATVVAQSTTPGRKGVRFQFTADGAWSDEDGLWDTDGAVLLDSLIVATSLSGTFTSLFDASPDGALTDGNWTAGVQAGFGEYGELYPGVTMVQEDPCYQNFDCLWAWTDAGTNYSCGGWPLQTALPRGPDVHGLYLNNEIWSPQITSAGAGDEYLLTFYMHRDLPLDNLQFYTWRIRSIDASGCPDPGWLDFDCVYYGGHKDWFQTTFDVSTLIDPAHPKIQIAIGAVDMCGVWCNIFGTGTCHSHAPLIDDIQLRRVDVDGPFFSVRHIDLFQDTFASDGTTTGAARADMAQSVTPNASPTILPGDSMRVRINGLGNLGAGNGPKAYVYVAVWPQGQAGRLGADMEARETFTGRGLVNYKRFPLVGSLLHGGATWYRFRMDTVRTSGSKAAANTWCFDLNDSLFTPGDTVCYVLAAESPTGNIKYFSRRLRGQGGDFTTTSQAEALNSPMEFTILPAGGFNRGGDILYVDDSDDRGGPVQLFFDTTFELIGLGGLVDRFDVLGPSSGADNSLASRVTNVFSQIIECYQIIIWCSGNLSSATIGDGTGNPEKSDDFGLLFTFLDQHPNDPGIYMSGDDIAEEWNLRLSGVSSINFRSRFMNHTFGAGDASHVAIGEPISPKLTYAGPGFATPTPDVLVVYGGCSIINDFDVLHRRGLSAVEAHYPNRSGAATLSQATPNAARTTARVIFSGYSYHYITNDQPHFPPDRVDHLRDIIIWLDNSPVFPPPPAIKVFPDSLTFDLPRGETRTKTLTIANSGQRTLSWTGYKDHAFLAMAPDHGTVIPLDTVAVAVRVDADELEVGTYRADITIESNDPRERTVIRRVTAHVRPRVSNFLGHARPSPFTPGTTIDYGVKEPGRVSLRVYNVAGQLVRTLVNEEVGAPREGGFSVEWDGRDDAGQTVSSGVYFYKLVSGTFSETKKMLLLR